MHEAQRVLFPKTRHRHDLPVGREGELRDGRGEVVECFCGFGGGGDIDVGACFARPGPAVVDVDDAAGGADGDPSVAA